VLLFIVYPIDISNAFGISVTGARVIIFVALVSVLTRKKKI
jgi:hypothetical protein